jgi:hypothetical protein
MFNHAVACLKLFCNVLSAFFEGFAVANAHQNEVDLAVLTSHWLEEK